MDYTELAKAFLRHAYQFSKINHQKKIDCTMRGEAFVTIYLKMQGGGVLPSEISTEMDISSARVAAVLNSLENKGMITRQIDRGDRRRIFVDLTPVGEALAEKYTQLALDSAVHILEILGERDAREFVRILGKLVNSASVGSGQAGIGGRDSETA